MSSLEKVALAIVGVAIIATLVVNGPKTAQVVNAGFNGFGNSLTAAEKG